MEVKKFLIPKTHIGIRYSKESTLAWKGMYLCGLKLIPKVEWNIFFRFNRRVVAIGYHRYW
jgi:hypothetical protein